MANIDFLSDIKKQIPTGAQALQPQTPGAPAPLDLAGVDPDINAALDFSSRARVNAETAGLNAQAAIVGADIQQQQTELQLKAVQTAAEAEIEQNRINSTTGVLGFFRDVFGKSGSVGRAFRDASGVSQRRVEDKRVAAKALDQTASIFAQGRAAAAERELSARRAPGAVSQAITATAQEVTTERQTAQRLFNDTRAGNLAAAREARLVREDIRSEFFNQPSANLKAIRDSVAASGQESITRTDPISGQKVNISLGQLERGILDAEKQELTLRAARNSAIADDIDTSKLLQKQFLEGLPFAVVKQIADNGGLFVPPGADPQNPEELQQFDLAQVTDRLTTLSVARETARTFSQNAIRVNKETGEAEVPQQVEVLAASLDSFEGSVQKFVSTATAFFPNGVLPDSVEAGVQELRANTTAAGENLQRAALGEIPLGDKDVKETNEEIKGERKKLAAIASDVAKRFGGDNANISRLVESRLLNEPVNPEDAREAFFSLSQTPNSAGSVFSTEASRIALQQHAETFNDAVLRGVEDGTKGVVAPSKGQSKEDFVATILASIGTKNETLTKAQIGALNLQALNAAGDQFAQATASNLLVGNLESLPVETQEQLLQHPFFADFDLSLVEARVNKAIGTARKKNKLSDKEVEASRGLFFAQALRAATSTNSASKFDDGLDAFLDFVEQGGIQAASRGLANPNAGTTPLDIATQELFAGQAANEVGVLFGEVFQQGTSLKAELIDTSKDVDVVFRNNTPQFANKIVEEAVEQGIFTSDTQVQGITGWMRANTAKNFDNPDVNANVGQLQFVSAVRTPSALQQKLADTKFQDPELESARKRLLDNWPVLATLVRRLKQNNRLELDRDALE